MPGPYVLAADDSVAGSATLDLVAQRTAALIQWTKDEDRRRKIGLLIGIGGALFAAVRLGIIVIPHIRKRRPLGELASNPPRRRRK